MLTQMRVGRKFYWIAALGCLLSSQASASPLHSPQRIINGQTVNLSPLFQWWTNHHGSRPLSAWVHVTGTVVGTNAWGWIVEGQIENTDRPNKPEPAKDSESGGPTKFLLQNPPLWDWADFERLSALLKALNQEHAAVADQEAQARNRAHTLADEQKVARRNRVQTNAYAQAIRQMGQVQEQAKAQLKLLDQQIQVVKTKLAAYPNPDHYLLDCFALDMGQEQSRMPVYDHGGVNN